MANPLSGLGLPEQTDIDALKRQLAECIRMLEKADIIDFNGQCSIRIGDDHILINQGNCQRSRITAAAYARCFHPIGAADTHVHLFLRLHARVQARL